eukprot:169468-Amphidinium_carterae.2
MTWALRRFGVQELLAQNPCCIVEDCENFLKSRGRPAHVFKIASSGMGKMRAAKRLSKACCASSLQPFSALVCHVNSALECGCEIQSPCRCAARIVCQPPQGVFILSNSNFPEPITPFVCPHGVYLRGDETTTPTCWDSVYTFSECCPNADCWDGGMYTYSNCCDERYGDDGNPTCW